MTPLAVYVHCPFCPTKCGYCDFSSFAESGEIVGRTARAIAKEILASPFRGRPAKTVFFGGGTPTFFDADDLTRILDAVFEVHPPLEGAEITSEANPGTADASKFAQMLEAGFNRLSLGAQSFLASDLKTLGRVHGPREIGTAVQMARDAGFENLNLDLMFALPGQSSRRWQDNLEAAIELGPEHLSLYCLTLEPNTPFAKAHSRGELHVPDEDAQIEMFQLTADLAERAGYAQYEISNFAQPGRECAHNLCYWRGEEYAGYGPGAVGAVDRGGQRLRTTGLKKPLAYCERIEAGLEAAYETEPLDEGTLRIERIMLGLRLSEGVRSEECDPKGVSELLHRNWAAILGDRLCLTPQGRLFCTEAASLLI